MPRERFLTEMADAIAPAGTTLTWVDQEFLVEHDVRPWSGERALPLWLPLPKYAGFLARDVTGLVGGRSADPSAGRNRPANPRWMTADPGAVKPGGLATEDETTSCVNGTPGGPVNGAEPDVRA